jgi:hypothetical protein
MATAAIKTPLHAGQRFIRPRLFKPADSGLRRWWLLDVTADAAEAAASGTEVVEVVEVVETKTVGKVVIFRQWVTDPDGAECLADLVPRRSGVAMRSEYSMRQSLWGMHFEAAL